MNRLWKFLSPHAFDLLTLYTTISHQKLKDRCFIKKNGQCRYKYIVLRRDKSYFAK